MKKTKVTRSLLAACSIVALMAVMTACVHDGDSDPPATGGDMTDGDGDMPDPVADQRTAIANAISAASSAVAAVTDKSTDAQVTAADNAITAARKAITDAADVPAAEKAANSGTVNALASRLTAAKASRTAAMDAQNTADMKATTAKAKALKAAIMKGVDGGTDAVMSMNIPALGTGEDATTAIPLKAGDAVASLGSWKGMDNAGMVGTGDTKTTGMTRIYSNMEADKNVAFVGDAGEAVHGLSDSDGTDGKNMYTLGADADMNIAGSKFPTTGRTTYTGTGRKFTGTYMGASGTYECTGATACTATSGGDAGITLAGTWTFTPNAGAMLKMKDAQYLYFGWWVRKDSKGMATHAGALYGEMVPTGGTATLVTESVINESNGALVGKATYMGKSAGKFAISDPLRPANDDAGHFTADAELMADFKATGSTLSGTIDNFRLNDGSDDPGWSVELQKAMFDNDGDKFMTNAATPADDRTVWSIGGNKSAASGKWEAQMFDEKTDDGSNVPTSVVGSFMSTIGTTHELVGAFGATKK